MSRFPTHPHPGLKHKTPEGQRFLYNGRAWLPDRSPEAPDPRRRGGTAT